MRAVKTVISAAGNIKREYPELDEVSNLYVSCTCTCCYYTYMYMQIPVGIILIFFIGTDSFEGYSRC